MNYFLLLKIAGTLQASYASYLGLTKSLRGPDGTLTIYGRRALQNIILGIVLAICGFYFEPKNGSNDNVVDLLKYPIGNMEAIGYTNVATIYYQNRDTVYFDSLNEIYQVLKSHPQIEANSKNKLLSVNFKKPFINNHDTIANLDFWIDSEGIPSYAILPSSFKYNDIMTISSMALGSKAKLHFMGNASIASDTISLSSTTFNLIYDFSPKDSKIEHRYYFASNEIRTVRHYNLVISSNNGRLSSLKDISMAWAFCNELHIMELINEKGFHLIPYNFKGLEDQDFDEYCKDHNYAIANHRKVELFQLKML